MINWMNPDEFIGFAATELLVSADELALETVFREIRTWSSLNALVFISRINEETDILISASDLAACKTLRDIHQLIISRSDGTLHH